MTDEEILTLFFDRSEDAIKQTQQKYGAYCGKITVQILKNSQDCEECWNETLLRVWNAIPPQRPKNFKLYLAAAARNVAFSLYRRQTAQKRGGAEVDLVLEELAECVLTTKSAEEHLLAKDLGETMNQFLDGLPRRDRNIFLRRYFFTDTTKEIAERYGMKESNVLVILSRTRKKLKQHLEKGGYLA